MQILFPLLDHLLDINICLLCHISGKYSLLCSINCSIAAMVSVCAGCNVYEPWASSIIAAFGALVYLLFSGLLVALRIDDPVDAIPVHGAGGIVGILAVPIFMKVPIKDDLPGAVTCSHFQPKGGFYEGNSEAAREVLGVNAMGAGWTPFSSFDYG